MSKFDVNLYFLEIQNTYFEMLDNLNEFKELAQKGEVSQEEYDNMLQEVDLLRANYERIAYIIMLLNKPKNLSRENADINASWYKELKGASKEVIIDESRDVLADLKKYIKEKEVKNDE